MTKNVTKNKKNTENIKNVTKNKTNTENINLIEDVQK